MGKIKTGLANAVRPDTKDFIQAMNTAVACFRKAVNKAATNHKREQQPTPLQPANVLVDELWKVGLEIVNWTCRHFLGSVQAGLP